MVFENLKYNHKDCFYCDFVDVTFSVSIPCKAFYRIYPFVFRKIKKSIRASNDVMVSNRYQNDFEVNCAFSVEFTEGYNTKSWCILPSIGHAMNLQFKSCFVLSLTFKYND